MKPQYRDESVQIYQGDVRKVLRELPDESVHCVVTSPPYWGLRDYGVEGQIGLEDSPVKYVSVMREVFAEVRRVLRDDGTLWLNMGDSYAGSGKGADQKNGTTAGYKQSTNAGSINVPVQEWKSLGFKNKDLVGVPWMLAFALREDGWYLRQDIIWAKPNPMPESVTDRCTKAHEYIFLLSKSERYYYNQEAILEPVSPNTHLRLSQDVAAQIGSARANGGAKTNGNMKAVGRKSLPETQAKLGAYRDEQRKMAKAGSGIKYNESFADAVCLPVEARNKRSVWEVTTQPFPEAHFATFPQDLIKPCILAGCPEGGTVLDPFMGSGTTGLVAKSLHCKAIGIELNPAYIEIAAKRLSQEVFNFSEAGERVGG